MLRQLNPQCSPRDCLVRGAHAIRRRQRVRDGRYGDEVVAVIMMIVNNAIAREVIGDVMMVVGIETIVTMAPPRGAMTRRENGAMERRRLRNGGRGGRRVERGAGERA